MIEKWFILAGGSATRWNNYLGIKNKCLVQIDGETLLERTQRLLKENGISDITIVEKGYNSKREAFEGIAKKAKCGFGILLGDCYYTEAIIKDAVGREVTEWKHYYNCLPNPWTDCQWEEGYIHLVPDWKWWYDKMHEFNQKVDNGEITFVKDFQIDRFLRGYSLEEYRAHTLDKHDIFWCDETDDFDYPYDLEKFCEMTGHKCTSKDNRFGFSIIIPHYNTPDNLRNLLDHLCAQLKDYPETEIIVIDDGSSSDMRWLDDYPVLAIYEDNRGAAAARNVGLMASTGKYIAFADADDDIEPNYLHILYQTMLNNDCDYIIFPFTVVANGSVSQPREELIANYAVWAWAFTWDCIGGQKFDESLNIGEDEDWLRRVVTEDKCRYQSAIPIYRYNWNANPNSLCKRYNRGELPKTKA